MNFLDYYNYWVTIALIMIGLYGIINARNLVKKLIGMAMLQASVLLFYISMGMVKGGRMPILQEGEILYVNPLPHVLMLTAIVVGIATQAVGLAITVRIKERYGTIEEDEMLNSDRRKKARTAHRRKRN